MAVVIRMMRAGAKKRPFYRVVAADSRRQRDGRFLEILGHYDPIAEPMTLKLDADKVKAWLAKGAQPSEQAASLFRMQGIVFSKASKPVKKAVGAKKGPAKKGAARAKPREKTERRTMAKVARAKKRVKIAAKAVAPKEKKKKS